jgi:hypothetical protein
LIPPFDAAGLLPPGIHSASWAEVEARFGFNAHRQWLLGGARRAFLALHVAGCSSGYLDGSFVTSKVLPGDYDACWSGAGVDPNLLDPTLLDFTHGRRNMKAKYLGDLFPAELQEGASGRLFLDFFQIDKLTGGAKGIVLIDLGTLP